MYTLAHMPINDVYLGMELLIGMFTCFANLYIFLPICYTVCVVLYVLYCVC